MNNMGEEYHLWIKNKKRSKDESFKLASAGSYEHNLRVMMVYVGRGSACYWKIAKKNDNAWMEWL